ncbi:hypothetical protein KFK09_002429 [Dendrobium nobile]|uniref:Uncharacterized protein n=1 Tax=Dendrobium nobile TaxID=94219 RepID=A0A8T3C1A8_DENNO|nr:hypothetical protein KFK09_002429 [Dendrobium nobile]
MLDKGLLFILAESSGNQKGKKQKSKAILLVHGVRQLAGLRPEGGRRADGWTRVPARVSTAHPAELKVLREAAQWRRLQG